MAFFTAIPKTGIIDLEEPVEARFAKLIFKAKYTNPEDTPIGVNG